MKASELAAMLLELAETHGDPHVYANSPNSKYVQAVEPESVVVFQPGGIAPMLIITGLTFAESPAIRKFMDDQ